MVTEVKKMCLCMQCIEAMRSRGEKLSVGDTYGLEYEVFENEPQVCQWCEEENPDLYEVIIESEV